MKLDIGWPEHGVVELVVHGRVHDDDGAVIAFALTAVPTHLGIVLDLTGASCADPGCRRAIRTALARLRGRTPAIVVRPGDALGRRWAAEAASRQGHADEACA